MQSNVEENQGWSIIPKLFCLRTRKHNNTPIEGLHKWTIYLIGLFETFVFTGCIFGWAQLVYVLKNEEIFLNLCRTDDETRGFNESVPEDETKTKLSIEDLRLQGCPDQDREFALIYTISCVFYSANGIFAGMTIHYLGLVVSRVVATLALAGGFIALGCVTKETTNWLYVSVILLAYGGNQLRLSGFQFCNLFSTRKSTALTIISGSYAASAGLFLVFQIGQGWGLSLWFVSLCLAFVAFVSMLASVIMPWHHIPYEPTNQSIKQKLPLRSSLFSISAFSYYFWFLTIVIAIRFYNLAFNPWISRISKTNEEAGVYSSVYSISCFLCPFVTPFPGMLNDYFSNKATKGTGSNKEKFLRKNLQSPVMTLALTLILTMILICCLLFNHYVAIYTSLVALIIIRPGIVSVGTAFIRIRFPPEHFDRLNGICGTFVAIFTSLQYPYFLWVQRSPISAIVCFTFILVLALFHPLHLLSGTYRKKIAEERFQVRDSAPEKQLMVIENSKSC